MKRFVPEDKHDALDEMLRRYTTKQLGKQQLQFELRVVAGRDALRQALLAMVPQVTALGPRAWGSGGNCERRRRRQERALILMPAPCRRRARATAFPVRMLSVWVGADRRAAKEARADEAAC